MNKRLIDRVPETYAIVWMKFFGLCIAVKPGLETLSYGTITIPKMLDPTTNRGRNVCQGF